MKILSKIFFFIIAAIILVVGYFIGTIVLAFIFGLFLLMTVLFIVSWLLNNILNLGYNKTIKYVIKLFLCVLINIGFLALFTLVLKSFLLTKALSFQIILIWVYNIIVFTLSYIMLKSRATELQIQKDMFLVNQVTKPKKIIKTIDLVVMVIFPALLTVGYYMYVFV